MPLIQAQAVAGHGWLTLDAFADLVTIAEMTPGPIALNAATFVGTQVAGLPGALVATAGNVLPSCLIVSLLAWLYGKYRRLDVVQGVLGCLRPGSIGGGDVKLMGAAGLLLGRELIITAFVIGIFPAGLYSLGLLLSGKAGRKDGIPFGPFLCLGLGLAPFFRLFL